MAPCYDEGLLRSYIDDGLAGTELTEVAAHLARCDRCRQHLTDLQAAASEVGALLGASEPVPSPQAALDRFRRSHPQALSRGMPTTIPAAGRPAAQPLWRSSMDSTARLWSGPRRTAFAGVMAVALMAGLLAFPPVRAAADQLLQVFRVNRVVFMPISPERIAQLSQLDVDADSLLLAEPTITNDPAPPQEVAGPTEAQASAGFLPRAPSAFPTPPLATKTTVHDRRSVEFQIDVDGARQILAMLDVRDVTLPDALGAEPIRADVPRWVETNYRGENYEVQLIQGPSPEVSLPDGVDLAQLGKAALRLLGMPSEQAESVSRQIDWSSTLVFPFPRDMTDVRQVTINGEPALLIGESHGSEHEWQLSWQKDGRFYILNTRGEIFDGETMALAESIR